MNVSIQENRLVLQPKTDLIASHIEALREAVLAEMKKHPDVTAIVVDAEGIEIVDSLGVNLIIGIYRQSAAESKTFEIINAGEKFIKVARFFRFYALFSVNGEAPNS
jgi:anti-anti-sigma factor